MKKIIIVLIVAVSALMARIECEHADRSSLELVLEYIEPGDATFVCREYGTRYEVAIHPALKYLVIGARSKSVAYDVLWIDRDIFKRHYYDDLGILVRAEMESSSHERLMANYRQLREMFNFQTNRR